MKNMKQADHLYFKLIKIMINFLFNLYIFIFPGYHFKVQIQIKNEARPCNFAFGSLGRCYWTPVDHSPRVGPNCRQQWWPPIYQQVAKTAAWMRKAQSALPWHLFKAIWQDHTRTRTEKCRFFYNLRVKIKFNVSSPNAELYWSSLLIGMAGYTVCYAKRSQLTRNANFPKPRCPRI